MSISAIIQVFDNFRMAPQADDQYEAKGKAVLSSKIDAFYSAQQPIKFSMLGYPFKSTNTRDKVLGPMPDLAEELSLQNFRRFADQVKEVYSPGVQFSFISDGLIFADIMNADEAITRDYYDRSRALSDRYSVPATWFTMTDFYAPGLTLPVIREKITTQFGISPEELRRRILFDPNVNYLYRGISIFMTEELATQSFPSNNQKQKKAKSLATEMMFRNEAYSKLIQTNFSDHIRLSMHPSINDGVKYSFQLIPGARFSPWHSCAVQFKSAQPTTMHRKDAEAAGYELVNVNNQPYYFQEA